MGEATTRRGNSDLVSSDDLTVCLNPACPQPQNPPTAKFCQACGTSLLLDGRYRLKSLLGEGGFGRTFLAEIVEESQAAKTSSQRCVVKQIYDSSVTGQTSFRSEAERLRQLGEHPQIPKLLDFVESAADSSLGQFLVQEFAAGKTLQQQVDEQGPMTEEMVRSLLISLLDVLQHVHSFQIVHRDIKPANIVANSGFYAPNDRKSRPMLVDFGAAKWVRHAPAETVIGSAGYAAPEQSMGQATFASDIYSLGLTCLHLLTGMHPFALYSAGEDRWVWQDYLTEPLAPEFTQVLEKMVARSLQQRYESASQVAFDLQSSQGFLATPKQMIDRALAATPVLKARLKKNSNAALKWLRSNAPVSSEPAALPASVTMPQRWVRLHRLAPDIGLTLSLTISPDGHRLVTGGADGAIRLWELPSGQLLHTFARRRFVGTGHQAAVTAVQFHPDGRAFYSASTDGTLKEWDSAQRCLLNTLPTPGWTPTALEVTHDGKQLISPSGDGQIVIWEIATLLPVAQLTQHQMKINAIALSPDNHLLISASDDQTTKLWRREGDRFQLAKVIKAPEKPVVSVAMYRDGKGIHQLVTAKVNEVLVYQLSADLTLSEPVTLYQSPYAIKQVAVSEKGCVAIATEDRQLTLWNIHTGDCVAKLSHEWGVTGITFSPDGQRLVTASADEVISIWEHRSN